MIESITNKLIDDLMEIAGQPLPPSAIAHAKRRLLDYIGVTVAGVKILGEQGDLLANELAADTGSATMISYGKRTTMYNAAFMNAFSAHVAELDDGERFSMMHPGAPIISAVLAAAENHQLNGEDLLKGMIMGFEAAIRIGRAIQPSIKERGFHSTGICGTIGAAVAVAFTRSYDYEELRSTISAAASAAAGLLEVIDDGSQLKPFNPAHAAMGGLIAATTGKAKFKGPIDALGGNRGLIKSHADTYDTAKIMRSSGDYLRVENAYVKPYAACRHCHPAIECAQKIMEIHGVSPSEIRDVTVKTYKWAVGGHDHDEVPNPSSAKMSTPYSVAVMLLTGKAGLLEYMPEMLERKDVLEMAKKVRVMEDDSFSIHFPGKRGAEVALQLNNGKDLRYKVDLPKGEPENPLSDAELDAKYSELAEYAGWDHDRINMVRNAVSSIETSLALLIDLLQ